MKISKITALEIIDSRGYPTVEATVTLDDGSVGRAAIPSGASTGTHEALELRDQDKSRFGGHGVLTAVNNIETILAPALSQLSNPTQQLLDQKMNELDGTENKSRLGANSILAVSLAFAWAKSEQLQIPLYKYIADINHTPRIMLPRPMFNLSNGGKHANWATDIQEYMVIPLKENSWAQNLRMGCEVFHALEKLLKENGYSTNVGNEGGFAPEVKSNQEALDLLVGAIKNSGYQLGTDIAFGFDAAASEFFDVKTNKYTLKKDQKSFTSAQFIDWIEQLTKTYPLVSLEDMLAEDDWDGWELLTKKLGNKIQIVGDDLLVTNVTRIEQAIEKKACNALLVKVNQIGTLTETLAAMQKATAAGWNCIVSHRSGETEDVTIAHLSVGTGCGQIKTGAPSRSERTAKYNELLRIEKQLQQSQTTHA